MLDRLEWPELQEMLADDPGDADVHVVSMGDLTVRSEEVTIYFILYQP